MAKTKAQIDRKHKLTLENGRGVDPSEASLALAFNVFFTSIPLNKPDKTSCEFIRYLVMILGQNCHHLVGSRHESIWNTHLSREKKPALLSIESWLYDRDPYRRSSPTNPLNDQGHKLFIAHLFKIWSQQTSGFERDETPPFVEIPPQNWLELVDFLAKTRIIQEPGMKNATNRTLKLTDPTGALKNRLFVVGTLYDLGHFLPNHPVFFLGWKMCKALGFFREKVSTILGALMFYTHRGWLQWFFRHFKPQKKIQVYLGMATSFNWMLYFSTNLFFNQKWWICSILSIGLSKF